MAYFMVILEDKLLVKAKLKVFPWIHNNLMQKVPRLNIAVRMAF